VVKIQDFICCDGYVCVGCAYDYKNGSPGDWARTGIPNNFSISNTGVTPGNYAIQTTLISAFASSAAGDLCVYKKDAPTKIADWSSSIKACQNGSAADGSVGLWYTPNAMEIYQLFTRFPAGTTGDRNFFGGASDATGLLGQYYLTSSEINSTFINDQWASGNRNYGEKKTTGVYNMRCVRRM
jgi:hypothetical protein